MEEMSKKTKRLEKENLNLTRKQEATNKNIFQMAEERSQSQQTIDRLTRENEKLKKLCRAMQTGGYGAHPGQGGEGTESEYEDEEEYDEEDDEEGEYEDDTDEEDGLVEEGMRVQPRGGGVQPQHQKQQQAFGPVPPPPPPPPPEDGAVANGKMRGPMPNGQAVNGDGGRH